MASKTKKAFVRTVGCRLNTAESARMKAELEGLGYAVTDDSSEPVQLGVFNTCTVTSRADADSRNLIRSFVRANPEAFVIVVGCYAQMQAGAIARIEGVDVVLGNSDKDDFASYIKEHKNTEPVIVVGRTGKEAFSSRTADQLPGTTRANLKVQDGCNFMCSYCIIPFARGRVRPRRLDNIVEEVRALAGRGFKELILTGINLGTYDFEGKTLTDVVRAVSGVEGIERIRLSSIEMTTIDDALLKMMADDAHALLPFLHLPLQSGCDRILKLMKRKYDTQGFRAYVERAVKTVSGLCLGTDVMVGFPGETDKDFEETFRFMESMAFSYFHVFVYSERKGTASALMPDKVPAVVARERAARLRKLGREKKHAFYDSQKGFIHEVLFETCRNGRWNGFTGNYIAVVCESEDNLAGRIVPVRLVRRSGEKMLAQKL